jgi:hypothetical protein
MSDASLESQAMKSSLVSLANTDRCTLLHGIVYCDL